MNKISDEQLNSIIEALQGTFDTLENVVLDYTDGNFNEGDLSDEQWSQIDNEIFLCEDCGWWCEISELSEIDDENICEDCEEVR